METWIAADCNFNDYNLSRTKRLIENWNKIVEVNDEVFILGNFYGGKVEMLKQILNQLNGRKIIIDYNNKRYGVKKEELQEYGFSKVYSNINYVASDKNNNVFLISDKELLDKVKDNQFYGAAAKSLTGQNKVWQNNILCISYEWWGDTPIKYEELPNLVARMIEFDNLEVD